MTLPAEERELPELRGELQIIPGSPLMGGAPSWMIYDPVQGRYFQISIEVFHQLSHWSAGTVARVIEKCRAVTGRSVDEDEVLDTLKFLFANSLTRDSASRSYKEFIERKNKAKKSGLKWLAYNYLFFRVPLVKPTRFLQITLPIVEPLFSRVFAALILLVSVAGLLLVARQWDSFIRQFSYLFNFTGLFTFGISLIVVKILHELSHAYTAARMGVRVSSMGVAFLVMMPVLYTDTTDAWRLKSSSKRAWIDAAGMIVELMIAGVATFIWVFLEDGPVRSAVFALATTGWVLSLLVNLNPFMRFDGYYLLADTLGIPNLQPRSFTLSKWRLREFLFGLNEPAPEPNHAKRRWMIIYGYMVWVYRLLLFLGIALLVYTLFFKVLGVILFFLEIAMFVVAPIITELKVWWSKRSEIIRSKRSWFSFAVFAAGLCLLAVPWSSTISVPAVLAAKQVNTLYSKHDAIIEQVNVEPGDTVNAADALLQLRSPQLEYEREAVKLNIALLQSRQARRVADTLDRSNSLILKQQIQMAQVELAGIERKLSELQINASFTGVVTDMNPDLRSGQWINKKMPLGTLVDHSPRSVRGYIEESGIPRVSQGLSGVFISDNMDLPVVDVELTMVSMANSKTLEIPYLASVYGGDIAVQPDGEMFVPVESSYLVEFEVTGNLPETSQAMIGIVKVEAEKESLAMRIWKAVAKVTVRELGV
ncbi:hypothetical protein AB833_14950 [Chromatiales bacterium (ex Bugula neritina AB1)]|nr:hypothetical protein AB833_14950 [Chromatiales bacterium (ex Bugula neritina AB1)]